MKKGVGLRLDVHKILYNIYRFNKILESNNIKKIIIKHKKIDIAFIYNVCMETMRYNFHVEKVIKIMFFIINLVVYFNNKIK